MGIDIDQLYQINRSIRRLRVGRLTAELLADGSLRRIAWNGTELLRSIYVSARDENWGNVPLRLANMTVEEDETGCLIEFRADHCDERVHFQWQGSIAIHADGTLIYTMDGEAVRDFRKNRVGFCLLHPLETAGSSVRVEMANGFKDDAFPQLITPGDPFVNIKEMHFHTASNLVYSLRFEGDLFQTEDQRNWTDGSFKTFCTPLSLPYPVEVRAGERISQRVVLAVHGAGEATANGADGAGGAEGIDGAPSGSRVAVGSAIIGKLPKLGTTLSPESGADSERILAAHRDLRWHDVRLVLSLEQDGWRRELERGANAASAIGAKLHIELHAPYSAGMNDFAQSLLPLADRVGSVSVYPSRLAGAPSPAATKGGLSGASLRACQYVTTGELLAELRRALADAGVAMPVGGGSRGNFAEWNRFVLPLAAMDYTEFAINPQVHASDLASVIETLPAQRLAVSTAEATVVGRLPIRVSSLTLKMEVNPYASDDEAVIASSDRERRIDGRLGTGFGAGWTIGSIAGLAGTNAESIRYFEHAGSLGMMEILSGTTYPVFDLFRLLADWQGAEALQTAHDPNDFAVLALQREGAALLLIANLREVPQTAQLTWPSLPAGAKASALYGSAAMTADEAGRALVALGDFAVTLIAVG